MDRPATSHPATAREIILEIVRNMREGLEPLQYSTLPPSIYDVYLSRDDHRQLSQYASALTSELSEYLAEHARRNGYALFGRYEDYYEDGCGALRMRKPLIRAPRSHRRPSHAFDSPIMV